MNWEKIVFILFLLAYLSIPCFSQEKDLSWEELLKPDLEYGCIGVLKQNLKKVEVGMPAICIWKMSVMKNGVKVHMYTTVKPMATHLKLGIKML